MFDRLNTQWDARTFRRISQIIETMSAQFDWFSKLDHDDQFKLAVQVANAQKIGIQRAKLILDAIPWIVTLIALLK